MKILVVASFNHGRFAPFVVEQVEALKRSGCEVSYFGVEGKGISGYLKSLPSLRKIIKEWEPEIIHAHYGLCGLLAGLQRRVPVVTTYHGSDINLKYVRYFSRVAMMLSKHNIYVSKKTMEIANTRNHCSLIPCGIDITELQCTSKSEARKRMNLSDDKKYVLFAGAFDNAVKNFPLAKASVALVPEAELIELKGYTREQVTLLMCAADAFLMTSISEGSPQVIKEAMACGCPIVSVDVGDVAEVTYGIEGCFICNRDPYIISNNLNNAFNTLKTCGRDRIEALGLSNEVVASELVNIYNSIINNR